MSLNFPYCGDILACYFFFREKHVKKVISFNYKHKILLQYVFSSCCRTVVLGTCTHGAKSLAYCMENTKTISGFLCYS